MYNRFPGGTIILFGSYSHGYDVKAGETKENGSDIDIAIVGIKEKKVNLTRFDKLLERTITLNFYNSWRDVHQHLKDSILDGITLSGGVEL